MRRELNSMPLSTVEWKGNLNGCYIIFGICYQIPVTFIKSLVVIITNGSDNVLTVCIRVNDDDKHNENAQ